MKLLNDLSYSNIVNCIQGDEELGAVALHCIAIECEELKEKINKLEKELSLLKDRGFSLHEGYKNVMKHLQKAYPLGVIRDGQLVVVTEKSISIEKNVIHFDTK